jgi:hypothetical protein
MVQLGAWQVVGDAEGTGVAMAVGTPRAGTELAVGVDVGAGGSPVGTGIGVAVGVARAGAGVAVGLGEAAGTSPVGTGVGVATGIVCGADELGHGSALAAGAVVAEVPVVLGDAAALDGCWLA